MLRILCVGQASYDISVRVDELPKEKDKLRFINKIGCGGGSASTASYLLAKWGASSIFVGVVGNDIFGNRIKKELQSVGVETRYIETSYEKDTTISFIMVNSKTGAKTIMNVADEYVKLQKFDFDFIPDIIYVDGHDQYASKTIIERYPKSISILDADRYTNTNIELAHKCNYLIASLEFAQGVSKVKVDYNNTSSLVNMYDELTKKFEQQKIIVTLGQHGALYMVDNQIKVSPALKVNIVDTTGAGDIFHGAFTYGIAKNWDIEKCIKYANIAAGLSMQTMGGRLSVPKLDEVNKIYESNN